MGIGGRKLKKFRQYNMFIISCNNLIVPNNPARLVFVKKYGTGKKKKCI